MTSHFVDKELAFVDGLEVETGRSLGAWMTEIEASGLTARNDIIDWLRQRGFTFAKASWLERIHHNGGALIYASGVAIPVSTARWNQATVGAAQAAPRSMPAPPVSLRPQVPIQPPPAPPAPPPFQHPMQPTTRTAAAQTAAAQTPATPPAAPQPPSHTTSAADVPRVGTSDVGLDAILAQGKAYRPLAQVLLREILATIPGADLRLASSSVVFEMNGPFCAMSPGPKGVRLDLPAGCGAPPLFQTVRTAAVAGLSASASLTDVRQIDGVLLKAVAAAARRDD